MHKPDQKLTIHRSPSFLILFFYMVHTIVLYAVI